MLKKKVLLVYLGFFALLLTGFYLLLPKGMLTKSSLPILNPNVPAFSFIDQNGDTLTDRNTEGKVYVTEYFFTTCKGICPRMNANMRRVYNEFKSEPDFMILSHTCMPETDSVPLLKAYEAKMLNGKLKQNTDASYKIENDSSSLLQPVKTGNWFFLTGDKTALYKMARQGYLIDNNKPDSFQNIKDQFIHTQFFALVDKNRRVRAIYDGLREVELQKLFTDTKELLKEKIDHPRFMNGFSNSPN